MTNHRHGVLTFYSKNLSLQTSLCVWKCSITNVWIILDCFYFLFHRYFILGIILMRVILAILSWLYGQWHFCLSLWFS